MVVAKKPPAKKPAPKKKPPSAKPPVATAPPKPSSEDLVRKNYGYMAWALDVPELHQVLTQAATEGWDAARLKGALEATNWWKTHGSAFREWTQLKAEDPATAQRQLDVAAGSIRAQAQKLGISIDEGRIHQMAEDSQSLGWSNLELQQAIASEYHYTPTAPPNATVQQLKQTAAQYLVPLSDDYLGSRVQQIMAGTTTPEEFQADMVTKAKSLYGNNPDVVAALDRGETMRQYMDPYAQIAARDLEISPDSVNFMDPKWSKAVSNVDQKTGFRTTMSLGDWENEIRTNRIYGYDNTQGGRSQATDLASAMLREFGAEG